MKSIPRMLSERWNKFRVCLTSDEIRSAYAENARKLVTHWLSMRENWSLVGWASEHLRKMVICWLSMRETWLLGSWAYAKIILAHHMYFQRFRGQFIRAQAENWLVNKNDKLMKWNSSDASQNMVKKAGVSLNLHFNRWITRERTVKKVTVQVIYHRDYWVVYQLTHDSVCKLLSADVKPLHICHPSFFEDINMGQYTMTTLYKLLILFPFLWWVVSNSVVRGGLDIEEELKSPNTVIKS
jgi:hypothetical protein